MRVGEGGGKYYSITFDVVVKFGLTELQAQLRWWEEVGSKLFFWFKNFIIFFLLKGAERWCVLKFFFCFTCNSSL
jgi:hypothetical protein